MGLLIIGNFEKWVLVGLNIVIDCNNKVLLVFFFWKSLWYVFLENFEILKF